MGGGTLLISLEPCLNYAGVDFLVIGGSCLNCLGSCSIGWESGTIV